jgi:hypothetical protein
MRFFFGLIILIAVAVIIWAWWPAFEAMFS